MAAPGAGDAIAPVESLNEGGSSDIVLVCEHAGNRLPPGYGTLGLPAAEFERHIAYDIGAGALTEALSRRLDAPAFFGTLSRLLVDLNRPFGVPSSMPVLSEATEIPGNRDLDAEERERRRRLVFAPFHDRLARFLDARDAAGRRTRLAAIHSFTPVFLGRSRPWHAGVLFEPPEAYGRTVLDALRAEPDLEIGENEPYRIDRDEDYAIPVHGTDRGYPAVLVEVRNDLLGSPDAIARWAERLAHALTLPLTTDEVSHVRA
ncbi:N-formylglutamate amidohydrolase [Aureimonas endophytica]|uniref:N-formylglutamate amidohydrolase n=1 Tax=Aureimonas endophytica TaxID=2027858 RepID=A0A916ZLW3_9HYPH|nr:N-formylglutamate amidohydrolase [Aureimonas endophytica]GGE03894.1 N-formylglutamate amidohydrolase [Aureimonas endophytica]